MKATNWCAKEKLAIDGDSPVRSKPLPLEFPGVHWMDDAEVEAAVRVLKSKSLFRYCGIDRQLHLSSHRAQDIHLVGRGEESI